jgi:hypothetical protein
MHVNPQGIKPTQEHINSQIELEAINQEWFMQIPLDNIMIIGVHIIQGTSKENTSALTGSFRLYNERFVVLFFVLKLITVF